MPQVPYNPVPEVAPQDSPAPLLHVQATPDAFGVGIAGAIKQLGGTLEKSGGELFDRAVAMQQLTNETERSNAVNEVEKRNSLSWEKFKSLQGVNAYKGFPAYQEELAKNRDEIRAGLSNPMVQKMFDTQANSITNRLMTYGAGHAAQQNKVAADGAAKAEISIAQDAILQNPDDLRGYEEKLKVIENASRFSSELQGHLPPQIENEVAKNKSGAMRSLIEGTNHTDPDKAKAMLDENRKYMHKPDIDHLEPKIQSQVRVVGSRNISDAVNKGAAPYMSPKQISLLDGVQEPLVRILYQAQRDNPDLRILPTSGFRTLEKQAELRARYEAGGPLAARPGESAHNFGRGVDVVPGAGTTYEQIDAAMKAASEKLGIPLSPEHDRIKYRDPGHFSIPGDYDVGTAPKKVEESEQSRIDRAEKFARSINTDDPLFADITRDRVRTDYQRAKTISRETLYDNRDTVSTGIMDRGDGQPASTIDEFLANPKVRAAYEMLPPHEQAKVPGQIRSYNAALRVQTDQASFLRLKGMAADDPQAFLDIDPLDPANKLSQHDQRVIFDLKANIRKHQDDLPNVNRALGIIMPKMPADEISKTKDPDTYWTFVGALQEAIHTEMKAKGGRPLGYKEIEEIGNKLRYNMMARGWFLGFGGGEVPLYKYGASMSAGERDAIRMELMKKTPNVTISDQQINIEVARRQYNKLAEEGKGKPVGQPSGRNTFERMKDVASEFLNK